MTIDAPETNRFGNIAMGPNPTVRNNWFRAAFEHQRRAANCQPPVPNPVFTL